MRHPSIGRKIFSSLPYIFPCIGLQLSRSHLKYKEEIKKLRYQLLAFSWSISMGIFYMTTSASSNTNFLIEMKVYVHIYNVQGTLFINGRNRVTYKTLLKCSMVTVTIFNICIHRTNNRRINHRY